MLQPCKVEVSREKTKKGKEKKVNKRILCGVRYDRVSEKEYIYFVSRHINEINWCFFYRLRIF
jgi:hypothetical protein